MRPWILFLLVFASSWSEAQTFMALTPIDTLRYSTRSGGAIDSIDVFNAFISSTNPGGSLSANNSFSPSWLFMNHGAQVHQHFNEWKPLVFSGLPHIGFNYSFGSQGVQNVLMNYQQSFGKNLIVNLAYKKNKANGFLRNGEFNLNDLQVQLAKKGTTYSFLTKAAYLTAVYNVNNGLLVDSLADDFDLRLLPVQKENAFHSNQRAKIEHTNFFDFTKDSLKGVGVYTHHELAIRNLRYTEESDTLMLIYNQINYDSTRTMDQNQLSSLSNGAGLFFNKNKSELTVGGEIRYWKYDNLQLANDTTEVNLQANYSFKSKRIQFSEHHKQNVVGAKQEFKNDISALLKLNRGAIGVDVKVERLLPDVHQRYIYANNYSSILQNPSLQTRIFGSLNYSKSYSKLDVLTSLSFVNLKDNYWFIDSLWRNDTLTSLTAIQFNVRGAYRIKNWHLQPSYLYAFNSSDVNFIPNHQINLRTFLKGGLFKAKKLQAYIGLDASYLSTFSAIQFNSLTGSYEFWKAQGVNNGYMNLHFFTGFQIDEFKFYVRFENIGYFWNEHSTPVLTNYPIPGTQFRIGLTWDFFN
jgi:hypothetical protein